MEAKRVIEVTSLPKGVKFQDRDVIFIGIGNIESHNKNPISIAKPLKVHKMA